MTERELMVAAQNLEQAVKDLRQDLGNFDETNGELYELYSNKLWSIGNDLHAIVDDIKLNAP